MTIRARRHTKARKQTTLLDGVDVGPPKQRMCWRGLNRSVHEAMNNISNVKVHLKDRSGNVNIALTFTMSLRIHRKLRAFFSVFNIFQRTYSKCSKILNTGCLAKRHSQTAETQIRLLLQKQSDQGLPCLLF